MSIDAINLFALCVADAIPYAITFALGELVVNMFMKMAFGGRVEIGV